jgi:hypothetical protein
VAKLTDQSGVTVFEGTIEGGGAPPFEGGTITDSLVSQVTTPVAYAITGINTGTSTVTIAGDHAAEFLTGGKCAINGSTGNDGLNDVVSVAAVGGGTEVVVGYLPDPAVDGTLTSMLGALTIIVPAGNPASAWPLSIALAATPGQPFFAIRAAQELTALENLDVNGYAGFNAAVYFYNDNGNTLLESDPLADGGDGALLLRGLPVYAQPSTPDLPATPTEQDLADALVTLGLVTQAP